MTRHGAGMSLDHDICIAPGRISPSKMATLRMLMLQVVGTCRQVCSHLPAQMLVPPERLSLTGRLATLPCALTPSTTLLLVNSLQSGERMPALVTQAVIPVQSSLDDDATDNHLPEHGVQRLKVKDEIELAHVLKQAV